jgi:DNA repair exonuclease SbcCD ATPase subunit
LKILKLTAENVKKLRVVEITPAGNVIEVTGPNGSGKSSVLDAIFYCLGGSREIPTQPIRKGALKAHVTLDLGEIVVTRKFTQGGGGSLIVEAKDGSRFASPQKMLDELLGKLTFDPLAFTRMDPKAQLEQLRGMVHLDIDIDQLDRENAADFEKRTDITRQIKSLEAQMSAITFDDDTPDEDISVADLARELESAGKHNSAIERMKAEYSSMRTAIQARTDHAYELRRQAERLRAQADECDKAAEEDIATNLAEQSKVDAIVIEEPIDTAELREMIDGARELNEQVARKRAKSIMLAGVTSMKATQEKLTRAMDHRIEQKQEAISNAKMPIAGLSFGEGEVLYRNLPFNQASGAEQLRISTAVAMAANPKLRVLRIQDGSLLDEHSMKLLGELAEFNDYQVWIERVDTSAKVGVVMEDGEVRAS